MLLPVACCSPGVELLLIPGTLSLPAAIWAARSTYQGLLRLPLAPATELDRSDVAFALLDGAGIAFLLWSGAVVSEARWLLEAPPLPGAGLLIPWPFAVLGTLLLGAVTIALGLRARDPWRRRLPSSGLGRLVGWPAAIYALVGFGLGCFGGPSIALGCGLGGSVLGLGGGMLGVWLGRLVEKTRPLPRPRRVRV
jgi:hypothetical protein